MEVSNSALIATNTTMFQVVELNNTRIPRAAGEHDREMDGFPKTWHEVVEHSCTRDMYVRVSDRFLPKRRLFSSRKTKPDCFVGGV